MQSREAAKLADDIKAAIDAGELHRGPYVFSYTSPTHQWSAPLFSMPCVECGKRCSRALPYCVQHLESEYHVRLGTTSLRDENGQRYDFMGLFASGEPNELIFARGEAVMPYLGEVGRDGEWLLQRYGSRTVPYGFAHSGKRYYTDSALLRGAGANVNMATPDRRNNVEFRNTLPLAMIHAKRDIYNGQELLLHYGDSYRLKERDVQFSTERQ